MTTPQTKRSYFVDLFDGKSSCLENGKCRNCQNWTKNQVIQFHAMSQVKKLEKFQESPKGHISTDQHPSTTTTTIQKFLERGRRKFFR